MKIFLSGLNFKTAPIEMREKLSLNDDEKKSILCKLKERFPSSEAVLLSTCNRTEFYIYSEYEDFQVEDFEKLVCEEKALDFYTIKKCFYVYKGIKSVRHLFRVACGLDSLVLGEDQILGQIRNAHDLSLAQKISGAMLNTLFRYAVTTAKKVKTKTCLSKNCLSIGSLAAKVANDEFGDDLLNKTALIVGAGEMGSLILKNLISRKIDKVYITNRSHKRALSVSDNYENVSTVDYKERYSVLDECDIVISATSSPHYTITRDMLEEVLSINKKRVFIDLAVPRDIDTSIIEMENITYYNVDKLTQISQDNNTARMCEAVKAEELIETEVVDFEKWYKYRKALPMIMDLKKSTEVLVTEKFDKTIARLKTASEEDKNLVRDSIAGMVDAIVNKFVYSVREYGSVEDMDSYLNCLKEAMKES